MDTNRRSIDFMLGGLAVRLIPADERWVASVGESVAVGRSARAALTLALEPLGPASIRALLADLALLQPSLAVAIAEKRRRSA